MPILDVIKRRELTDAMVVVVRYFGGIKLGAGGLVRAYSHAASIGVDAAVLARRVLLRRMVATLDYASLSTVEHWARQKNLHTGEASYAENVRLPLLVEPELYEAVRQELADITAGMAAVEDAGTEEILEKIG